MRICAKIRTEIRTAIALICGLAWCAGWTPALASPTTSQDSQFLSLRQAGLSDDATAAARLAAGLNGYEMTAYVDYYRLKPRLMRASDAEVREFLTLYDGSAIADRLRNDWLLILGFRRDWENFDAELPRYVVNDDTQVKCYGLLSKITKGQQVAQAARELLLTPRDYGEACMALLGTLFEKQQFDQNELWRQIRLASDANVPTVVRRTAALMGVPEKSLTQALDSPARILAQGIGSGEYAHQLYLLALGRVARSNSTGVLLAAQSLLSNGAKLSAEERATGWGQIALPAARSLAPEARDYWARTQGASLSNEAHQWQVRTALREGDWKRVRAAIELMPTALQNEPTWVYWQARALKQLDGGQAAQAAQSLFQSISGQTHFYGQLALEELGRKISIPASAQMSAAELAAIRSNPGLQRAIRFFGLGLRFEGVREWNWELRRFTERQHLAAAEFARENNILDRMVNTSDRTKTEVDFTQRFPSPHLDVMELNTQTLGLDKAWVYGLIRQESRFILNARSNVGASGLMQIMPATARYVAKKIKLSSFAPEQVNDIRTNILLGTNYLNLVLGNLDGSQTLATAAYNAGPGRPRAWRLSLPRPVEGAIFAETIPFTETRGYVKNVLSNATYYAALFDNKPQSLKERLGMVSPNASTGEGDLPDTADVSLFK